MQISVLKMMKEFLLSEYDNFQRFIEDEHEIEGTEAELFVRLLEDHIVEMERLEVDITTVEAINALA